MRVSKETAVLLKEAGYDGAFKSIEIGENGDTLYLPTLHEAADWLRSKGVHVSIYPNVEWQKWMWNVVVKYEYTFAGELCRTFDSAYEAGIVYGLKYVK